MKVICLVFELRVLKAILSFQFYWFPFLICLLLDTTLGMMLRMLLNILVGRFLMTVLFEWILIGDFKMEGNGAVVEVAGRWVCSAFGEFMCAWCNVVWGWFELISELLYFDQVRDEYRTDYDPDILFLVAVVLWYLLLFCLMSWTSVAVVFFDTLNEMYV